MADQISHEHHYVPRWYQKRFLASGEEKLWYLDLKPEKVVFDQRRSYTKRALFRSYPAQCFWLQDLYLLRFGKTVNDVMEKVFFGKVDDHGEKSVRFFATRPIDGGAYRLLCGNGRRGFVRRPVRTSPGDQPDQFVRGARVWRSAARDGDRNRFPARVSKPWISSMA